MSRLSQGGAILLALCCVADVLASDHIDGPLTRRDGASDLTDLYAFSTQPGSLLLAMNVYPLVPGDGHFRDDVEYRFLLRPHSGTVGTEDAAVSPPITTISCRFDSSDGHDPDRVRCSGPGLDVSGRIGSVLAPTQGHPTKLFAGQRADPFFFDNDWAEAVSLRGEQSAPGGTNTMADTNVLSIVLEVELASLGLGDGGLLGIAAETISPGDDGEQVRLDRIGRPEITNVCLIARDGAADLRDDYNRLAPFLTPPTALAPYRARLLSNILWYDRIDGESDFDQDSAAALADLLIADFLILDTRPGCAGPLSVQGSGPGARSAAFFDIETAWLRGEAPTGCGGRRPDDDVMDILFTMLVRAGRAPPLSDGVDAPDAAIGGAFPYLAEPHSGFGPWLKSWLGQKVVRPSAE